MKNQEERNTAEDTIITKNLFRLKKDNGIKDKTIRGIKTLFKSN